MVNRDPLTKAPNVRLTMCEMIPGSRGEMINTINQTARVLHRGALLPLVIAPLRLQNGCLLVGQKGPISKAGGNVLAARAWVVGKQQVIPIVQAIPMGCMPPIRRFFSIDDKNQACIFLVWLLKHSFAPGALAIFQYLGIDDRSLSDPINFYQFMVTTVGKHLSRAFNAGISRMTDSYFRPPFHRATL